MQQSVDGSPFRVMLMKDNKPICLTRCSDDPPLEIPNTWKITKYKPRSVFRWNCFPQFRLFPEPQNFHHMREWGEFSCYLRRSGMTAVAYTDNFSFYILPPNDGQDCTYCVVHFLIKKPAMASELQKNDVQVNKQHKYSIHSNNTDRETYESGKAVQNSKAFICPSPSSMSSLEDKVMVRENSRNNIADSIPDSGCKAFKDVKMCSKDMQHPFSNKSVQSRDTSADQAAEMLSNFRQKNYVKTDPSYLKTLSQTHSAWIFGAIAELVDNSRDAHSTRLDISVELLYSRKYGNKIPVLSIIDDGDGMTYNGILRMLSFGHKQTNKEDQDRIGKFGIGFKTGAMKLGHDALVLTQSSTSRSIAFLSQTYNENKDIMEIPIVSYIKNGRYMEIDKSVHSEEFANFNLSAIKEYSPFNEYLLGEQLGLFGEDRTGTQIFIWNLDKWGSDYTLVWNDGRGGKSSSQGQGDILIRSKRIRSRHGQISHEVPLDYSLQAYLEVLFLNPRMKIFIQGSLVKSRPLEKSLSRTVSIKGSITARPIQLVLGRSKVEWDRMNGGIFLYWKGRLIEAYKRVGGMKHNADVGRGVVGVADVTDIMDNGNGHVWVLNSKQGFQDCEIFAKLEDWLGNKVDNYWDENYDNLNLKSGDEKCKPDHDWVQCDKCRKWRMISADFNIKSLPLQWFCFMPPFNGNCEVPEQQVEAGVITVGTTRIQHEKDENGLHSCANNSSRKEDAAVDHQSSSQNERSQPMPAFKENSEASAFDQAIHCKTWCQKEKRSTRVRKTCDYHDLKLDHKWSLFTANDYFSKSRSQAGVANIKVVTSKRPYFFRDSPKRTKKF